MGLGAYFRRIFEEPDTRQWYPHLDYAGEPMHEGQFREPPPFDPKEEFERYRKPRLAAVTRAPAREDFAIWRDNPVTQFVFAALRNAAREQQNAWISQSWDGGKADQRELDAFRVRADGYKSLEEADYEGFCEWAGVEPERAEDGAA